MSTRLPPDFDAGRLVMVDITGTSLDAATADFLRQQRIRAVCLFRKNLGTEAQVRQLTRDLREVMGPQALIGLDQEGGSVVRATFRASCMARVLDVRMRGSGRLPMLMACISVDLSGYVWMLGCVTRPWISWRPR